MRLAGRIRALERHAGIGAPCPKCGGAGWPGAEMVAKSDYREPMPLPEGSGCPACGKVSDFKWIILPEDPARRRPL